MINKSTTPRICAGMCLCILLSTAATALSQTADEDETTIVRAEVEERVTTTQRAGFVNHDLETYMSLWAPDIQVIRGRRPAPGPHDWTLDFASLQQTRALMFSVPPGQTTSYSSRTVAFSLEGDTAVIQLETTVIEQYQHVDGGIFRLRKVGEQWVVFEYRWWPISETRGSMVSTYDDQLWAEEDRMVELGRADRSDLDTQTALDAGYRIPEAYELAVTWTEEEPRFGHAWLIRGRFAMELGRAQDAITSYRQARRFGMADHVPAYVPE